LSQRTPITACEPKIVAYFKFLITTPLCLGGINIFFLPGQSLFFMKQTSAWIVLV